MGLFCVYVHTAPNGKKYVGITSKKPEHRWNNGRAYWQNSHFSRAIEFYGWDNFSHEVICVGLNKEEACKKERELIQKFNSNVPEFGYNLSTGGECSAMGFRHSKETIERMSAARKGRTPSEETKRKMSAAKKGKPNGHEGKCGAESGKSGILYQINEATREVVAKYYGYNEMNRITGFAKTPVKEAVSGKRKRAYGFIWGYEKRGAANVVI